MDTQQDNNPDESADIPGWRRVTALLSLGSLTILGGLGIASLLALFGLITWYILENAVAQ